MNIKLQVRGSQISYGTVLIRFCLFVRKDGSLIFLPNGTRTGDGMNNNTFSYSDLAGNTYTRKVSAANNVITFDQQGGSLTPAFGEGGGSFVPGNSPAVFPWAARLPGGKKVSSVPPF